MLSSLFTIPMIAGRATHVIGLGALGRPIAECLYRKGVQELHLHDFDIVEARNRFNQRVFAEDVGRYKADALASALRRIYPESETNLVIHRERVVPSSTLSGIVFCAVDWNRIRYEEVLPCVKNNNVSIFLDGRVGLDGGKAYGLDPRNENHMYHFEGDPLHNHPDPDGGEMQAACRTDFPLPENADAVASEVLWRLTCMLHLEQGATEPYDNFVGWQYIPKRITLTEQWDEGTMRIMSTQPAIVKIE